MTGIVDRIGITGRVMMIAEAEQGIGRVHARESL